MCALYIYITELYKSFIIVYIYIYIYTNSNDREDK